MNFWKTAAGVEVKCCEKSIIYLVDILLCYFWRIKNKALVKLQFKHPNVSTLLS